MRTYAQSLHPFPKKQEATERAPRQLESCCVPPVAHALQTLKMYYRQPRFEILDDAPSYPLIVKKIVGKRKRLHVRNVA